LSRKEILEIYVKGNVHVSLAGIAWIHLTQVYTKVDYNGRILIFAFCATFVAYSFIKFHHFLRHSIFKMRWIFYCGVILFASGLAVFQFLFFSTQSRILLLIIALITFLYAVPIFGHNLRNRPGLKIYLVALTWTLFSGLLPLFENAKPVDFVACILLLQRFLLLLVFLLVFDITDLQFDSPELHTIPQQLGLVKTKILGMICLLSYSLLGYLLQQFVAVSITVTLFFASVIFIFLFFAKPGRSPLYSNLYLESVPIIWCLFTTVF
jgi:hypothetical protein